MKKHHATFFGGVTMGYEHPPADHVRMAIIPDSARKRDAYEAAEEAMRQVRDRGAKPSLLSKILNWFKGA